jgi:biopolymer transport protein ExbD
MSTWQVRPEGTLTPIPVESAADVLAGLRDGVWRPTDDVKGPADPDWTTIESHPAFEEAAGELEPPPAADADETHLDMNPLIDVCLVLLIFFILTITYESLERAISVPHENPEKGASAQKLSYQDIKDRVFRVSAWMDDQNNQVIKLESDVVKLEDLEAKMKQVIDRTGRREMLLDIDGNVPWGVQAAILDAAAGNKVHEILYHPRKRK